MTAYYLCVIEKFCTIMSYLLTTAVTNNMVLVVSVIGAFFGNGKTVMANYSTLAGRCVAMKFCTIVSLFVNIH